ncbi:hypothetical protein V3C99_002492 [Haemonchus contortus]|uniref:Btz domain-containing protein n=1 Tax=Haemonchus placei TaxID=6290 RepID=A0A158QK93_HAEPC|nr:unnamed protein product [Haemonchus placei]
MDPMLPSPNRGRSFGQKPYRGGGANWRGSNTSERQQYPSPYQDVRSNPNGWSDPRYSFGRGNQHQSNRWQGRQSYGTPRTHASGSYNKKQFEQRKEADIRAYVIPAMTGNPWKHLEEQRSAEGSSA